MATGKLSTTFLIFLLLCLKYGHSGVKKIKIHVPYYVKHVHHYKKVYVPKIHVIKHEHHHKKEYDHHHHHHEIFKHGPYRSYDKSSLEYPDELQHQDIYYDDLESKSYHGHGRKRLKPYRYRLSAKEQYRGWKDIDGSDYSGEEEEDYSAYRKNIYFKRRLDEGGQEAEEEEDEEEKNKEEEEGEESEEEEENPEENTTPVDSPEDVISITTTDTPLP